MQTENYFFIRINKRNIKVNIADILFIEAWKNYILINTKTKQYMILLSMRQMEELLPSKSFCRIHRSFIIAVEHMTAFDNYSVYFGESKTVPIGEQYRNVLGERIKIVLSDVRKQAEMPVGNINFMETNN